MSSPSTPDNDKAPAKASNFLRQIIENDLTHGTYSGRHWGGTPGDATHHEAGQSDPAKIRTRFPPEPNGYLHVGHAKSICLNFGLARDYGGVCHMRFDDTNPEKEEQEYVDSILDAVKWLGFSWDAHNTQHLFYASNYFDFMYRAAEYLIETGHAYVDEQTPEDMRANRGDFVTPGKDSPFRSRTPAENLARFREMRDGKLADGAAVLRAKISMASPNINLRDPAIYRIRRATHHNTGDQWCIYPMYTFAHPIEDALENITHSICTLEFEDQRPFYDWLLERIVPVLRAPQFEQAKALVEKIEAQGVEAQKEFALHCFNHADKLFASAAEQQMRALFAKWEQNRDAVLKDLGAFFALLKNETAQFTPLLQHALDGQRPNVFLLPHQHEFARLNLTYVITSKRKLAQLVNDKHVSGWDDPRMPTIVGLRRRGFTPESIQNFAERIGVTKDYSWIDYSTLEGCLREDLDVQAPRAMAVLDPVKLVITNWDELHGAGALDDCSAPVHPHHPNLGKRAFKFGRELWIERTDYEEVPPKGYHRLYPGNKVRLKYGHVIECKGAVKDANGDVTEVHAELIPDTKSGTPGSDAIKVKGVITWVGVADGVAAEVRLYDRLFTDPQPDAGGKDFLSSLNPDSLKTVTAYVEPALASCAPDDKFQFERHGYFVADRKDHAAGSLVFNLTTTLKDSWSSATGANIGGETIIDISALMKRVPSAIPPSLAQNHHPAVRLIPHTEVSTFVEPTLRVIHKGSDTSPFVIIRASGAVGKSELAKYIAYKKKIPLWDLGQQDLGDHVFVGALTNAFGDENYSAVINSVAKGDLPLAIDALDEAEVRSGGARIENVLREIATKVKDANRHSVFLFSRVDTADFVYRFLSDLDLLKSEVPVYEIAFFDETKSRKLIRSNTKPIVNDHVLNTIVDRIEAALAGAFSIDTREKWQHDNFKSFMGYAPVLMSIASLINLDTNNPKKLAEEIADSEWITKPKGSAFLYQLINFLLEREQKKFTDAIKVKPEIVALNIPVDWDSLYTPAEQLARLAADKFADTREYDTKTVAKLHSEVRKHYARSVSEFYPQHPFLRGNQFANPAFRDYLLAWAMKSDEFSDFAADYSATNRFAPTPILFSLYTEMPGLGLSAHVGNLIDSFASAERGSDSDAQAIVSQESSSSIQLSLWVSKGTGFSEKQKILLTIDNQGVQLGSRVRNIAINVSCNVSIGENGRPLEVSNVDIVCDRLMVHGTEMNVRHMHTTDDVSFSVNAIASPTHSFTINCRDEKRLSIVSREAPTHPWKTYTSSKTGSNQNAAVQKTIDDLVRIVRWFRKDGKEEFARYKELIDFVVVGGDEDRRSLLKFMQEKGLVRLRGSLYVMTTEKASQYGISWSTLRNEPPNQALLSFIQDFLSTQRTSG